MPYGLIFDMDGVLADTEALNTRATIAMFEELYGHAPKPEDFIPYIGKGDARYVEGPAQKIGIKIDTVRAVKRRREIFMELLNAGADIRSPGARELIDAASQSPDWRICIATSSDRDKADATLRAAEIPVDQFDGYINGSMVKKKKPDPEIFLTAAKSIGLDPTSCVGIEDAIAGVEALHRAGMKSVAITSSFSADTFSTADLVVESLRELTIDQLRKLFSDS